MKGNVFLNQAGDLFLVEVKHQKKANLKNILLDNSDQKSLKKNKDLKPCEFYSK